MKLGKKLFLFIITTLLVVFVSEFVSADNCGGSIECHCGDYLIESQTMWYDLINCQEHGLIILVDNITLDCSGHLIDGDVFGTPYHTGILFGGQGATVTNCNIQEFQYGIFTNEGSSNHIITYNTINDNRIYGIFLHKNYNNVIYGNTIINNRWYGIILFISSNNDIYNNEFVNNVEANAFEYVTSNNNNWNSSNVGNYWNDFPSNPGYPNYYEISGLGDGIDWHPIWEFPNVWITLTPIGNTTFPASGGVLDYNIAGGNNEPTNVILDIWVDVTLPNSHPYGPVVGPVLDFNMLAYPWQTNINRELTIPARAPAGTYTLNGYLGEYNAVNPVIYAESHFDFIKEGTERDSKFNLVDSGGVFK